MSKQKKRIENLEQRIESLDEEYKTLSKDYDDLMKDYFKVCKEQEKLVQKKKRKFYGDISFDFWPISDWKRFGQTSHWNAGKYFQFVVGPFRFEFFEG